MSIEPGRTWGSVAESPVRGIKAEEVDPKDLKIKLLEHQVEDLKSKLNYFKDIIDVLHNQVHDLNTDVDVDVDVNVKSLEELRNQLSNSSIIKPKLDEQTNDNPSKVNQKWSDAVINGLKLSDCDSDHELVQEQEQQLVQKTVNIKPIQNIQEHNSSYYFDKLLDELREQFPKTQDVPERFLEKLCKFFTTTKYKNRLYSKEAFSKLKIKNEAMLISQTLPEETEKQFYSRVNVIIITQFLYSSFHTYFKQDLFKKSIFLKSCIKSGIIKDNILNEHNNIKMISEETCVTFTEYGKIIMNDLTELINSM